MNNISKIQLRVEEDNAKYRLKAALDNLCESYSIKGNVFALGPDCKPVELSDGYFVEEKVYDNLKDCIADMKLNQAISVNEDKFILGDIKKLLGECDKSKRILDIECLTYVV